MSLQPQSAFTTDAAVGAAFGSASSPVLLPGTPSGDTVVRVANLGPCHLAVALGTTNAVTVTPSTGIVVLAGQVQYIGLGINTYIAGVSCGGPGSSAMVNIATGN